MSGDSRLRRFEGWGLGLEFSFTVWGLEGLANDAIRSTSTRTGVLIAGPESVHEACRV